MNEDTKLTNATDGPTGLPAAPLFASDERFSISKNGWLVFDRLGMDEVVLNDAKHAGDEALASAVQDRSTLDLPAFCERLEGVNLPCVFSVDFFADNMEKPIKANLVPKNLVKFLTEIGELLLSGVVGHIGLSFGCVECGVKANASDQATARMKS